MSYTKLGVLPPKSEWPIGILPYPSPKFRMDNAGDPFTPTLCNRGPLLQLMARSEITGLQEITLLQGIVN